MVKFLFFRLLLFPPMIPFQKMNTEMTFSEDNWCLWCNLSIAVNYFSTSPDDRMKILLNALRGFPLRTKADLLNFLTNEIVFLISHPVSLSSSTFNDFVSSSDGSLITFNYGWQLRLKRVQLWCVSFSGLL